MFKSIDFLTKKNAAPHGPLRRSASEASRRGFALVEPLLIMGIMAILGSAVVSQLNPGRQYAAARNSQRRSSVTAIAAAIRERTGDYRSFAIACPAGPLPTSSVRMAKEEYDIAPCLVPEYLSALPYDPSDPDAYYESIDDYDTNYTVSQSATSGIITVAAPRAELGQVISATTRQ